MGEHQLAYERQLGPKPGHLLVKMRHAVENLDVMEPTVIHLVFQVLQNQVISIGVVARLRLGPGHEQNLRFPVVGPNFLKILRWGAEFARPYGASQHEDGHEETNDRDLEIVEHPLNLPHSGPSQNLDRSPCGGSHLR
ncbi:unnamed protein product [Calypogeia fissa]